MTSLIKLFVVFALNVSVGFWRNDRAFSGCGEGNQDTFVGIISLVRNQRISRHAWQQSVRSMQVMHLPCGKRETRRVSQGVAHSMNFRAQSAFAATDCLRTFFFTRSRAMLMGTNDCSIDHGVFIINIAAQVLKDPFPHAVFRPTGKSPMDVLPISKTLREITPRNARPIAKEY